jgi:glutamate--cysteine ligase
VSLDRSDARLELPVTSLDDVLPYFREAEKPPARWRVGMEHEKLGLYEADHAPVPFDGPRGIQALLERIAERDGWTRIQEDGRTIALQKNGASITLEPGGQLELSGEPKRTVFELQRELQEHLALMCEVSAPFGIVWVALGLHPFCGIEDAPRMPRVRHELMREYLPTRGPLGLEMMHLTGTVQANFDYESETDMASKLRAALAVTPIVSALYANSSLALGKPSGFVSRRVHIWRHTDPDRTGILPFAFERDLGYADYAHWAFDVPMFFVVRDGRYQPARGLTFRRFVERGLDGARATLADFDRHLTTLFPEVRLKRFIEVRGADAVPPALSVSLPALWKGVLYDTEAREGAFQLAADWSAEEREALLDEVARRGLAARAPDGRPLLALAHELVELSDAGLRRQAAGGDGAPDERCFLDPVREQLELGASPGQILLEHWEGDWARSPRRLIEYARYC